MLDEDDFTVLHGLASRGRSNVEALERATGLERNTIERALARLTSLAAALRGDFVVTPDGEAALRQAYAERFAECRRDDFSTPLYGRFESVDRDVKQLITQWQLRPFGENEIPNDHSDGAYDEAVLERLRAVHERAEGVLDALSARLPLFARYAARLGDALERAEAGENEWVSGVRCDSYHTVWFELHENLLRVLGKTRKE